VKCRGVASIQCGAETDCYTKNLKGPGIVIAGDVSSYVPSRHRVISQPAAGDGDEPDEIGCCDVKAVSTWVLAYRQHIPHHHASPAAIEGLCHARCGR
jgi:hypothetical protein